jgi:hypothetical protein
MSGLRTLGQQKARQGNTPGGRLLVPRWCQCVDGQGWSPNANAIVPYSAQVGNAVLNTLPEKASQVTYEAADQRVVPMGA